jgi:hypothetical protein
MLLFAMASTFAANIQHGTLAHSMPVKEVWCGEITF